MFRFDRAVEKVGLILGDQLNLDSALLDVLNPQTDAILMLEVMNASKQPQSSWQRTTLFLSAMRHFAKALQSLQAGWQVNHNVYYVDISQRLADFCDGLQQFYAIYGSQFAHADLPKIVAVLAGDDEVKQAIDGFAKAQSIEIEWLADNHFISEPGEFAKWLKGKKQPRMEFYYRQLRQRTGYLMEAWQGKLQPIGGQWNYDKENRKSFGKQGPKLVPKPKLFAMDETTLDVLQDLQRLDAEGDLNLAGAPLNAETLQTQGWVWPVTREQALQALADFIAERLPSFGDVQDAMWTHEPWLYHSRLSSAINMKLLNPREVIEAAIVAYDKHQAPLNAVEGFVRQILGWREYVRGLYWSYRKDWPHFNALNAQRELPSFYWTGKTKMNCLSNAVGEVLVNGYGHHIQRLMVTGLFALLYGVKPKHIHEWYLGMYVDALAWVEIPNTIGMSQFADGGIVGSKPYIASGAYLQKMSNYCEKCAYNPTLPAGESLSKQGKKSACPISTLYWDFIARHQAVLEGHPRLGMQWKNWQNKTPEQQQAIREQAQWLFDNIEVV